MENAPFHADVADAPAGARAFWIRADDGVRLRLVLWAKGDRGTVLVFPGRTEYVEKYGPVARDFQARGYAVAAIDWRGQGLSDRLIGDPMAGHVGDFADYQHDVTALVRVIRALELAEPLFVFGHSMGACIALRSLHDGLSPAAVAFSAPMWGVMMHSALRPAAWALSAAARGTGQGLRYAPGTTARPYIESAAFEGNMLTRDRAGWDWQRAQLATHPELALGGPTLHWLHAALIETRRLVAMPAPDVPAYVAIGGSERIVDPAPVARLMASWPGGRFDRVEGAEHELLMESADVRQRMLDGAARVFAESALRGAGLRSEARSS